MLERLRRRLHLEPAAAPPVTDSLLSSAVEHMAEGAVLVDPEGRILYLNESARSLTAHAPIRPGATAQDWLRDYQFFSPDGSALSFEQLPAMRALAGHPVENQDLVVQPKGGPSLLLRVNARVVYRNGGVVAGAVVTFIDVTSRRGREQALRRLAGIVESSLDAILTLAPDGTVLTANAGAEKLYGYKGPELVGRSVRLIVAPELERDFNRMNKLAERGETVHFETIKVTKSGRRLDAYVTASPVRDARGRVIAVSNICHDITDRRAVERELAEKAQLLDSAHDAIIVRDAQGRVLSWNVGAERTYGWTAREAVGRVVHELLRTTFPEPLARIQASAREKGEWLGELRHVHKDGRALIVASRWVPRRDAHGEVTGYLEVNRDETARARFENELTAVLDQMPALAFVKDLKGRFLYVNRRFQTVFKVSAADALGRGSADLYPAELARRAEETDRRALAASGTVETEQVVHGPDGDRTFLEIKFALRGLDGKPYAVCGIDIEITERTRTEAALRERDERLHAALTAASAGTWRFDFGTAKLTWDEGSVRLFGADRQLTFEEAMAAVDKRDRERVRDSVHRSSCEGCLYEEEFRVNLPDGSTRWLKSTARTYYDRSGQALYMTGAQFDVTAAHRQRRALAESEERQRLLYENVQGFAFIFLDAQGRVASWNASAQRLLGYSEAEALGREYSFFYAPREVSARLPEEHLQAALAQGRTESEGLRVRKDGSELWVNVVMTTLRDKDGRLRGFAKIMRDITAQRRMLEALQRSEARFRTLAESSPVGVFQRDVEGNLLYVNKRAGEIIGFGPEGSLGRAFLEAVHPEDRERVVQAIQASARTLHPITLEHRYRHRDGKVVWVYVQAVPQLDEHGRMTGYIGTLFDITERREAEEALRRAMAELERSNTELEQFAYVASHDLQEPLRKIMSFAELLQRRYTGKLDADADRFLGYLIDGAGRLRQLIVDLLNYSRLGRGTLALQTVDAGRLVSSLVETLQPRIAEAGADVVVQGPLPRVTADPGQLEQLFTNLIANALKFAREGVRPRVEIAAERAGDDWKFSVADNGIGIPPEFYEKLFVPFKRLHGRLQYPGTGIGLAICRRVVERHGGRIWIEAAGDGGAKFCFTLPVSPAGRTS